MDCELEENGLLNCLGFDMECKLKESDYMLEYHFDLHEGLFTRLLSRSLFLQSYLVSVSEIKTWA